MASKQEKGKKGEKLAEKWLCSKGYHILHSNWRSGRYEIDIIASRDDSLHFIEVKTSCQMKYGFPEQRIGPKKLKHLLHCGSCYLQEYPEWKKVQYDIIAIQWLKKLQPSICLIEDVYFTAV